MMRKHILDSIKQECYVRLKPSKVCEGVGVFALRRIPKGTVLFADAIPDKDFVRWDQLDDVPTEIISYLSSICNTTEKGLFLSQTVNNINLSYYVNHSLKPNVWHDKEIDRYFTLCDIEEGEEILCTYDPEERDW
jgi:SET domain-containing protein